MLVGRTPRVFEYNADEFEKRLVERTILSLATLDALIVIFVQCFAEQITRGGHHQKLYVDTLRSSLEPAAAQLVR